MVKVYVKPDCSVIVLDMTEAINMGIGTNAAGEESQLSKKNVFIEDSSEEESWGENPFGHGSIMDDSFVNVKWND